MYSLPHRPALAQRPAWTEQTVHALVQLPQRTPFEAGQVHFFVYRVCRADSLEGSSLFLGITRVTSKVVKPMAPVIAETIRSFAACRSHYSPHMPGVTQKQVGVCLAVYPSVPVSVLSVYSVMSMSVSLCLCLSFFSWFSKCIHSSHSLGFPLITVSSPTMS